MDKSPFQFRKYPGPVSACLNDEILREEISHNSRLPVVMAIKNAATPAELDYIIHAHPHLFQGVAVVHKGEYHDFQHHRQQLNLWGEHDGNA